MFLTDVERHSDGMEHEVDLTAEYLLRAREDRRKVLDASSIGRDEFGTCQFAKLPDLSHTASCCGVGEGEDSALLLSLFSDLPSDRLVVECAEDNSALTFQKVLYHSDDI